MKAKRHDEGCVVAPRRAASDLRSRLYWDDPKAAEETARRILESAERLAAHPHMGRSGRILGTRELVVSGTSYIVPYRIKGEQLELIAVFHGRQKWPTRLT